MPVFYFHQRSGDNFIADEEGSVFSDLEAARRSAVTGARSLLSEEAQSGRFDLNQQLELHDAFGKHCLTVWFEDVVRIAWPPGRNKFGEAAG